MHKFKKIKLQDIKVPDSGKCSIVFTQDNNYMLFSGDQLYREINNSKPSFWERIKILYRVYRALKDVAEQKYNFQTKQWDAADIEIKIEVK